MSASATFQLKTDTSQDIINEKIDSIWLQLGDAYSSGVRKDSGSGLISISLCYYFGHPKEEQLTREIIDYLFSIAKEDRIYYIRDPEAYIYGADTDYPQPITINDVFTEAYKPGFHDGVSYRYLIRKPHNN